MSIINKIKSRVSYSLYDQQEVAEELIKMLLDAGVCTPNHYNTEPWRYLVLQGNARNRFGDFLADRIAKDMDDPTDATNIKKIEKMRKKPLRAPAIIVAGAAKSEYFKSLMIEDVASVSAGCQNILLAAAELGLVAMWRTGSITYAEDVAEYLGFNVGTQLVGFIYLGYAAKTPPERSRKTHAEFTRWMNK
jgi:nitroreductase